MGDKEKIYRYRLREEERVTILEILAGWLKETVQDFRSRHEKGIKAYKNYSGQWAERRELRKQIQKGEEELIQRIQDVDHLLQKWSRNYGGRPWIGNRSIIDEYGVQEIFKMCDKILNPPQEAS